MLNRLATGLGLLLGLGLLCADPASACYYCWNNACTAVTGGNGKTHCVADQVCTAGMGCSYTCTISGSACSVGTGGGGEGDCFWDPMNCEPPILTAQVVPNGEPTSMWKPALWAGYQSRPAPVRGTRRSSCAPAGAV